MECVKQDLKASSSSSAPQTHKHLQLSYEKNPHSSSAVVKASLSVHFSDKRSVERRAKSYSSKFS